MNEVEQENQQVGLELSRPQRALLMHRELREIIADCANPNRQIQRSDVVRAFSIIELLIRDLEPGVNTPEE